MLISPEIGSKFPVPRGPKVSTSRDKPYKHHKNVIDYRTTDEMGDLDIPAFLQHSYLMGDPPPVIKQLRDWQKDLLSRKEWVQRQNCVSVAPTSGGKTLIAEVAIAQLLEEEVNAKALYALPFVALAAEKCSEFIVRFKNYVVRPFYQNIGGSDFTKGHIAVCTYEKAHAILNSTLKRNLESRIKLIIIDEAHMIGDESRGVVVEALIMKICSMKNPPRIICLTATLNNEDASKLATCIKGFSHLHYQRSSELIHYVSSLDGSLYRWKDGHLNKIIQAKSIPIDKEFLIPMVKTKVFRPNSRSVLIFVNKRSDTKRLASFLYYHLNDQIEGLPQMSTPSEITIQRRNELVQQLAKSPAGVDKQLAEFLKKGIAFHHAGLLLEERNIVETGIKEGLINIVIATTTLSAGVNIRSVSRVIIYSPYRGYGSNRKLISPALFAQMAGRSGRTDVPGEVVTIVRNDIEMQEINKLITEPLPRITTHLSKTSQIDSYILQTLSLGLAMDVYSIQSFLSTSFDIQDKHEIEIPLITKSLKEMSENGLIDDKYIPTKLGAAISSANLLIEEGIDLNRVVSKMMQSLCLVDDLHLLFLCTPSRTGIYLPSFQEQIWEDLFEEHQKVICTITSKSVQELKKIIACSYSGNYEMDKNSEMIFERIYGGCVLEQIIQEKSLNDVEKMFEVDRGTIQSLQTAAASFAGQATRFCESMEYYPLAAALSAFRKRLSFGVKNELIDLMTIPSMRRDVARILYDNGFKTASDVSNMSNDELVAMMPDNGNESELQTAANQIIIEADELAEQLAVLEEYEEESSFKKLFNI